MKMVKQFCVKKILENKCDLAGHHNFIPNNVVARLARNLSKNAPDILFDKLGAAQEFFNAN